MVLYLLSLFSFESATFVGQRFERTYTGDYIIKNSIISDVDNNLIGGSIFFDNPNGSIKFLNTVFCAVQHLSLQIRLGQSQFLMQVRFNLLDCVLIGVLAARMRQFSKYAHILGL